MTKNKSVYFASDFHLGSDTTKLTSRQRELIIVEWLKSIKEKCHTLYLVGDVFDYWFEYKEAIPKGYTRLLATLAEFSDCGIEVHLFTGNHDMWIFDYFKKELGLHIHYEPWITDHYNKKIYIAHGDGLGPGDNKYKMVKKILTNEICQWLFHRLHPNFGLWLMRTTSSTSRHFDTTPTSIEDMEKEWMVIHSRKVLQKEAVDYFVYGHRHFPILHSLTEKSSVLYLGDWMHTFTYGILQEDGKLQLDYYKN